jgi:YesN/AraC family two-component response regulator
MIRVVVADDHGVIRDGLRRLLDAADGIEVVATAADGEEAVAAVADGAPTSC